MGGKITHHTSMFVVSIATCQKNTTTCPQCRQSQAFLTQTCGADAKLSSTGRRGDRAPRAHALQGGSSWLVLPMNLCVQCSIPIKALLSLHFFQHSPFLNPCVRVLNSVFQAFQAVSQIFINNLKHHPI